MRELPRLTRYPVGSKVQQKTGYVFVKKDDGSWESEHRLNFAQAHGRDLKEGEAILHINGDKADNRPSNLTHQFRSTIKYNLITCKTHYIPNFNKIKHKLSYWKPKKNNYNF